MILDGPIVLVDIETNGLSHTRGRVIEVAAIRVENNEVVDSVSSVLDPETEIPFFISQLTGITRADVAGAPTFADIADELYAILDGAVFVAHNVRFDYSFLKQEFKRLNKKFNPKQLCTVKLSRTLYPEQKSHKLENIIQRCGIEVENRHRAYDDALALWQFIQHSYSNFPAEAMEQAIKKQLRTPTLPKGLPPELMSSLPNSTGVYIFQDEAGNPLYIGKSVNIKNRVLSHFRADHEVETEFKMSQGVTNIEIHETGGELEALLLESRLIKDLQPLYNRRLRRNQKLTLARQAVNADGFMTINIEDLTVIDPDQTSDILAVYSTKGRARESLNQIIKDWSLCPKLLGFEKGSGSCFLYQLKKCSGACVGKELSANYNSRLLLAFERQRIEQWPYKSPVIISELSPNETAKSIVVDQWCVIADIWQEEYCSPKVKYHERVFDLDTYKILKSYIRGKIGQLSIKPISSAQLQNLTLEEVGLTP